jgi:hypothetical protein
VHSCYNGPSIHVCHLSIFLHLQWQLICKKHKNSLYLYHYIIQFSIGHRKLVFCTSATFVSLHSTLSEYLPSLLLLSCNSYMKHGVSVKFCHLTLFLDSSLTILQLFPILLTSYSSPQYVVFHVVLNITFCFIVQTILGIKIVRRKNAPHTACFKSSFMTQASSSHVTALVPHTTANSSTNATYHC